MHAARWLSLVLMFALVVPAADGREPVYGRKAMLVAQEALAADVAFRSCEPAGTRWTRRWRSGSRCR